jgi:hypothetical protein
MYVYLFVLAAPPLGSTGICPVDPPPYRRYDDESIRIKMKVNI